MDKWDDSCGAKVRACVRARARARVRVYTLRSTDPEVICTQLRRRRAAATTALVTPTVPPCSSGIQRAPQPLPQRALATPAHPLLLGQCEGAGRRARSLRHEGDGLAWQADALATPGEAVLAYGFSGPNVDG